VGTIIMARRLTLVAYNWSEASMTIKQIRAFLAVAQSLSFAVACERLHLSQSALSLTIKAL